MPLNDITVDTNVFLHAQNPIESRNVDANNFLKAFLESETNLCFDEGFSHIEAQNRSKIWHEYLEHFVPGDLGLAIVTHLAQTQRLKFVSTSVDAQSCKKINQLVSEKTDRWFVKACINSTSKIFVSHD